MKKIIRNNFNWSKNKEVRYDLLKQENIIEAQEITTKQPCMDMELRKEKCSPAIDSTIFDDKFTFLK